MPSRLSDGQWHRERRITERQLVGDSDSTPASPLSAPFRSFDRRAANGHSPPSLTVAFQSIGALNVVPHVCGKCPENGR